MIKTVCSALLGVFLFTSKASFSQLRVQTLSSKDQVSIPTPNVASLGQFGEVPVSYFTGIPNIEVPLYTFSEGKLSVPIKLSYHASGFRPDVHPGWVGMNWALSVGGVISRKVNGLPDDLNTLENAKRTNIYLEENEVPNATSIGYFFNVPLLNPARWNEPSYIIEMAATNADIEPDEFSFSFPNGSGKFFLDMDGTWKVSCDRAVKVVFNNTFLPVPYATVPGSILQNLGYSKTFSGFTIIDTDGTRYVYGSNSNFIEYSIDFVNQDRDFWQADSWYLKEMIEPSGRKISFEYARGEFLNQLMQNISQNFGTGAGGDGFWVPPCGLSSGSFRETVTGRLNAPLYLKKIIGATGTVNFAKSESGELDYGTDYFTNGAGGIARDIYGNIQTFFMRDRNIAGLGGAAPAYFYKKIFPILYHDEKNSPYPNVPPAVAGTPEYSEMWALWLTRRLQWNKLDRIEIRNNDGQAVKSFKFDYERGLNKRLSLSSVNEISAGGEYQNPYSFYYNSMDEVP